MIPVLCDLVAVEIVCCINFLTRHVPGEIQTYIKIHLHSERWLSPVENVLISLVLTWCRCISRDWYLPMLSHKTCRKLLLLHLDLC